MVRGPLRGRRRGGGCACCGGNNPPERAAENRAWRAEERRSGLTETDDHEVYRGCGQATDVASADGTLIVARLCSCGATLAPTVWRDPDGHAVMESWEPRPRPAGR